MLQHDQELLQRLRGMVDDLQDLHVVSGLGFVAPSPELVEKSLQSIAREASWRFVDLRGADALEAEERILNAESAEVMVAAVKASKIDPPLAQRVRAFIDRPKSERRRSLFVLCEGAAELAEVTDRELSRISYWSFMP